MWSAFFWKGRSLRNLALAQTLREWVVAGAGGCLLVVKVGGPENELNILSHCGRLTAVWRPSAKVLNQMTSPLLKSELAAAAAFASHAVDAAAAAIRTDGQK